PALSDLAVPNQQNDDRLQRAIMGRVRVVLVVTADQPAAAPRMLGDAPRDIDPTSNSRKLLATLDVIVVKATLDLCADSANQDLCEQVVKLVELHGPQIVGARIVDRSEGVSHLDVDISNGDRGLSHEIAARNLTDHSSALAGSSNQYSSRSGTSSSSTTELSQASSVSSLGAAQTKLCPTANPEPIAGSSAMSRLRSLIATTTLSSIG